MRRPAEEPGALLEPSGNRRPREMVTQDRIRLTGLLRKKPWKRGFFYGPDSPATRQARCAAGLTAVSVEPPGAVARRGLAGCAGYEPLREGNANTRSYPWTGGAGSIAPVSRATREGQPTNSLRRRSALCPKPSYFDRSDRTTLALTWS
jgi:hypothetical protein